MTQTSPWLGFWMFLSLVATGLALGPALAHLLELPNKLPMDDQSYHTVQQIYRGWAWLALVLAFELIALIGLAVTGRHDPVIFVAALVALAALVGAQAIFWTWTAPANAATNQWTEITANYAQLRTQWEYSHAAGALLQLVAMISLSFAAASTIWRAAGG